MRVLNRAESSPSVLPVTTWKARFHDLDLPIVWDTPLAFLARTVELCRRLRPRVSSDLLVYTPDEIERMAHTPLVRRALEEGRVLYEAVDR